MEQGQVLLSSVRNAVRLLRQFSHASPELGIKELSERLQLHKSAVFRLVRTLVEENVIQQNPKNKKYSLSVGAFEIGTVFYHEIDICTVAFPVLGVLADKLGEVIQLAIYDMGDVVYLLKFPEDTDTLFFNGMGRRVACHCTAVGKLLLAFQDQSEIDRYTSLPMKQYTQKTVTDPTRLKEELDKIRQQEYAESYEQYRPCRFALSVPIFSDLTERVTAAISITCPTDHYSPRTTNHLIQEMKKCSKLITGHLDTIRWKKRRFAD
ncbi:IclR family transcriptional regulator [Alicyclobacillus fastidiosus]|uniref:IclR family transcriptional regulator n=1 Tax=Alicyclobacillus fastidiosus TaxID=392011 RepID=A0ABV5AHK3_9BACL|nr:IclR family transcriptional regulator [Alicyclobacillus fastidiosus]WEH08964.1 IclR family transcriptional regulator [Alicyclobacillus fastidiosus]